ncbi:MAG TPA: glycosyltransferase family 4 protein [Polyangiales bacterium]|nr:glycosyltransferase family 4 protein [Polyangiales bacterium]
MRIGYLTSLYPAPSHTFIRREVLAVREHGVDVATFSVRMPGPEERAAAADQAAHQDTFYLLPMDPVRGARAHLTRLSRDPIGYARTFGLALKHRVPGLKALALSVAYFAESIVLADELDRQGVTHVHNHFANPAATVGYLATRHLGLPWSLTLHGISETDYPAGVLLGAKLEAADFAACVSHFGRAQALRLIPPEHWDKLFIVRCALDLRALPAKPIRAPGERVRVICVARLSAEKGHVGLLRAFAKAQKNGARDSELVLVGDGPERKRIEQAVAELGLEKSVTLLGRKSEEDTLREVAKSDLLVLASFMEGLPVVLMEALAYGLPVIAPRVAGVPELVEENVHGLLFAPAAWDELADRLQRMLSDAALRQRLGAAGRAKIEREFEISSAVTPLVERYRSRRNPRA